MENYSTNRDLEIYSLKLLNSFSKEFNDIDNPYLEKWISNIFHKRNITPKDGAILIERTYNIFKNKIT